MQKCSLLQSKQPVGHAINPSGDSYFPVIQKTRLIEAIEIKIKVEKVVFLIVLEFNNVLLVWICFFVVVILLFMGNLRFQGYLKYER